MEKDERYADPRMIRKIFRDVTSMQTFTYLELEEAVMGYLRRRGLTSPEDGGEDVDNFTG